MNGLTISEAGSGLVNKLELVESLLNELKIDGLLVSLSCSKGLLPDAPPSIDKLGLSLFKEPAPVNEPVFLLQSQGVVGTLMVNFFALIPLPPKLSEGRLPGADERGVDFSLLSLSF